MSGPLTRFNRLGAWYLYYADRYPFAVVALAYHLHLTSAGLVSILRQYDEFSVAGYCRVKPLVVRRLVSELHKYGYRE